LIWSRQTDAAIFFGKSWNRKFEIERTNKMPIRRFFARLKSNQENQAQEDPPEIAKVKQRLSDLGPHEWICGEIEEKQGENSSTLED